MSEQFRPTPEAAPVLKDIGSESGSEKKKKKDSKNKAKARILGGITAEKVVQPPAETKETEAAPKAESLWQKLMKDETAQDMPDKKEPPADAPEKTEGRQNEKAGEDGSEQLENLSNSEEQEAVRQYTEARLDDVAQSDGETVSQDGVSAENAADTALLESIRQKMAEQPERPVAEVLDEAEQEVVETIKAEEAGEHTGTVLPDQEPVDRERFAAMDTQEDAPDDAAAVPPPVPPAGGSATPPGGNGGRGRAGAAAASAGFNAAPAAASRAAAEQRVYINERAAVARGLVVGGIVGYLIGKRRGRIKTERKLAPVQEKLKKQVETLTSTVAEKEQRVRTLAAEKAAVLQSRDEKQRFAERLRPAPSAEVVSAKSDKPERAAKPGGLQVERLGKMVVETPAAIFAGAAVGGAAAERLRDRPPVAVDFNRKVETYSAEELKHASEKIRIDGVTLKDIQETYHLDERSVRRVMKQFVEGGNVREALNREIVEKELKYERDPRMRAAAGKNGGLGSAGGAAAVASAGLLGLLGADKDQPAAGAAPDSSRKTDKGPMPDAATLAKLKKKQAVELAAVSTAIIVFFAVLILLAL